MEKGKWDENAFGKGGVEGYCRTTVYASTWEYTLKT